MILVTGGTGHLGSHLLCELVRSNLPVRALYRNTNSKARTKETFSYYKSVNDGFDRIEWVQADINDYYSVCKSLTDVTLVFHAAGYVSFNDREKKRLNHINIDGTTNIVNACLEAGNVKLGYVSSIAALGDPGNDAEVTESILWNKGESASSYALSKYRAEMEVWRGFNEGLDAFIINPAVIIGPGMWMGPGSNLWHSVEKGLKYYPSGSAGFVDVRDVAEIMLKLSQMDSKGERFILVGEHMKHRDFLSLIARGLHTREPYIPINPALSQAALVYESLRALFTFTPKRFNQRTFKTANEDLIYSNSKIKALLGKEFLSVEESVNSAIEIYRKAK